MAIDPMIGKRNWSNVMEEIIKFKNGSTLQRWKTAIKDKAFDSIRALPLLKTQAALFYRTKGEPLNIVIPCGLRIIPFCLCPSCVVRVRGLCATHRWPIPCRTHSAATVLL
jgi:hypothetical protein